ncbi:MAG: hypothetical protein RR147_06545 [Oscillospiraceae bacterium]
MIYYFENMVLEVVGTLLHADANDVLVASDLHSPEDAQYTLLVIRDSGCKKKLLSILEASEGAPAYQFYFARNDELIYGFPYRAERRFSAFARGQMATPAIGEEICLNLIMECVSTELPPPILYLILTQDNINISKDNGIFFTPIINLAAMDETITERECTVCCARMILHLLEGRKKKELKSCELIRKKCRSNSYSAFSELYRDIRLTAIPAQKTGIRAKIKGFWQRNRDRFFHIFLWLCVLVAIVALIMLISQLVFGDIPMLRLFKDCFETIGTEHMK